ncbi:MAG: fructosamine kinase family protein [Phycisphaerales bacterium]|nr:fructosamine kinase family protein [Phycisphaerales bacterium]
MADKHLVEIALRQLDVMPAVAHIAELAGGCIHGASVVTGVDGAKCVVKISTNQYAAMLTAEVAGLQDLALTDTVLVPHIHGITQVEEFTVLAMEFIEQGGAETRWEKFGVDLARLHAMGVNHNQYGYSSSNYLGYTPQQNTWCDDWVEFNAKYRIGYQQDCIRRRRHLPNDVDQMVSEIIERLSQFIPSHPKVSLLHGDLWSGNVVINNNGGVVVIDPACSYGDGWADIAMMQLFGGFPAAVIDAYIAEQEVSPRLHSRLAVYQLYHVLNHVNLFGQSYVSQTGQLCQEILAT